MHNVLKSVLRVWMLASSGLVQIFTDFEYISVNDISSFGLNSYGTRMKEGKSNNNNGVTGT